MEGVKRKDNPPILRNGQFVTPTDRLQERSDEYAGTDVEPAQISDASVLPHGQEGAISPAIDLGGLAGALAIRREAARKQRDDAYARWQERLKDADSYMESLARQLKPADTTKAQRNLRTSAAMQAFGELLGAAIGGVIGFGRKGQGYVARIPGLAQNTLDRLERLRQQGVLADAEYRRRTAGIMSELAQTKSRRAEQEYKVADNELRNLDKLDDYAMRQAIAFGYKEPYAQRRQEERINLEEKRQDNRKQIEKQRQSGRIYLKSIGGSSRSGKDPLPDDVVEIKEWLLPKEKMTTRDNGRVTQVTTAPYTSYPKQLDAAVEARARKMAPIVRKYDLSKQEAIALDRAVQNAGGLITWQNVEETLEKGYTVQDIITVINQ